MNRSFDNDDKRGQVPQKVSDPPQVSERVIKLPSWVTKPESGRSSKIVPDLRQSTIDQIKSLCPRGARRLTLGQAIIDEIVRDKNLVTYKRNFGNMVQSKPLYCSQIKKNGMTIPPNTVPKTPKKFCGYLTGKKPLVIIGSSAFVGGLTLDASIVFLYSTIMHEYQHAVQWQDPKEAMRKGKTKRELEATLWEIENNRETGMIRYSDLMQNVWNNFIKYWQDLKPKEKEQLQHLYNRADSIMKKLR